jgi:hypothetical protein
MAASKGKRGRAASARPRERLPDDMLDEVDRFHKDADSESLDDAVEYDVDEDDVEGALDFEDSEPDSDEDVRAGGKLAKSAFHLCQHGVTCVLHVREKCAVENRDLSVNLMLRIEEHGMPMDGNSK